VLGYLTDAEMRPATTIRIIAPHPGGSLERRDLYSIVIMRIVSSVELDLAAVQWIAVGGCRLSDGQLRLSTTAVR
jgi:hypothetical protein